MAKDKIKIVFGDNIKQKRDIQYPKSRILVLPINRCGVFDRGVVYKIINNGGNLGKEIKEKLLKNNYQVGDCFTNGACRLLRRQVKVVCCSILHNYPNEYISSDILDKCIKNIFEKVIRCKNENGNNFDSITFPHLALDFLPREVVARIMIRSFEEYCDKINIKLISDDKEFVEFLNKYMKVEVSIT